MEFQSILIADNNDNEKIEFVNQDHIESSVKQFALNKEKLVIITDFDYTLTKRYPNRHVDRNFTTYGVTELYSKISDNYKKMTKQLFEKNHPVEIDHTRPYEERYRIMERWYRDAVELVMSENLKKDDFRDMVIETNGNFKFRNGALELFELVRKYRIPVFIISAGLYDIIDNALALILPCFSEIK
jgi:2-hydroxy-3-keto-5-methylthiopentenyl-1-phosphate phosphatase